MLGHRVAGAVALAVAKLVAVADEQGSWSMMPSVMEMRISMALVP
jgi:hypothetical protein